MLTSSLALRASRSATRPSSGSGFLHSRFAQVNHPFVPMKRAVSPHDGQGLAMDFAFLGGCPFQPCVQRSSSALLIIVAPYHGSIDGRDAALAEDSTESMKRIVIVARGPISRYLREMPLQ